MICVFPDPYPDELLYSVCARYSALMQYPNKAQAIEDFFGKGASAIVDLPGRLDYLISSLPPGHLYTADEFIDKHTIFPFYAPYLPKDRAHLVREAMRFDDYARAAAWIRRLGGGRKAIHLRFCPECAQEDRAAFGETYWHRLHQLHGVDACAHHDVFLEETDATWHNHSNSVEANAAELFVKAVPSRRLDKSNSVHLIHSRIAQVASFLLDSAKDSINCEILAHRYKDLLLRQGLAYYNGQVRTTKLINNIKEYYPAELLAGVGCDFRTERNWINKLVSEQQSKDMQHPICHILLLVFLDCDPEEIFNRFVEFKPFGDSPWPCLNPAADHYKKPRVLSCKILHGTKKDKGKPRGVFSCHCGYVYARVGPDTKEADRFTSTIVQAYGELWETLLRELWDDMSFSIDMIARRLGVSILTLKRRVVALGMRFPRSAGAASGKVEILSRYKLRREPKNALLKKKKRELLALMADNPKAGRAELRRSAHSLLIYIQNADPLWLEQRLPPRKQSVPRRPEVDWAKEDIILAKAVSGAIAEINASETPTRISVKAITKRVGQLARIRNYLDKMPQTASILNSHLESTEDFLVRRIGRVEEAFRREQIVPTKTAFARRALVSRYVAAGNEVVCRAMEDALLRLRSDDGLSSSLIDFTIEPEKTLSA